MHAVVGETVKPGASNWRRFVGVRSVKPPWLASTFDFVKKAHFYVCLLLAMSRLA
jgi:hypothetical protein